MIPMSEEYEKKVVENKANTNPPVQQPAVPHKKSTSGGFGGMQGGFLNRKPQPKPAAQQ